MEREFQVDGRADAKNLGQEQVRHIGGTQRCPAWLEQREKQERIMGTDWEVGRTRACLACGS